MKGTTKDIAVAFSIGIITKAENYNNIEGKFKTALKKCFLWWFVLKTVKLDLSMYGKIISKPNKNLKNPAT